MSDYGDGADTYFAGNSGWTGLTAVEKSNALDSAAAYMDSNFHWKGSVTDSDQSNAWPRVNVYDLEGRAVASDTVPTPITSAFYEVALRAAQGTLFDTVDRVEEKTATAGSVSVSKKYRYSYRPAPHGDYVTSLVKPYVIGTDYILRA